MKYSENENDGKTLSDNCSPHEQIFAFRLQFYFKIRSKMVFFISAGNNFLTEETLRPASQSSVEQLKFTSTGLSGSFVEP